MFTFLDSKHSCSSHLNGSFGTVFGNWGVPVNVNGLDPNTQGIYASTDNSGKISLVVVNKSPTASQAFDLTGVPAGKYFLRHFGGGAGIAKWQVRAVTPCDLQELTTMKLDERYAELEPLHCSPPLHCCLPSAAEIDYCQSK